MKHVIEQEGYHDATLADDLAAGFSLVGETPKSHVLPSKMQPASMSTAELERVSDKSNKALRYMTRSCGDPDTDEKLWNRTMVEVERGWFLGPLEWGNLLSTATVSRRFPIIQSEKVRPIDDLSQSQINATVTSHVHAFIRCARFLQWLAARCLALPMSCYFDDFVSFTTPALAMNTQAALCLMLDIFGWVFDKEGPKSDDFSDSVAALGVIVELSHTSVGRLLVGNTQKRLHESIEFVRTVIRENKLTKKDALTLRGRLGYCDAFIFGRIGKVALQNITRHAYAQPFALKTDQHLNDSLSLLEDRLSSGVPRCFDLNVHRTFSFLQMPAWIRSQGQALVQCCLMTIALLLSGLVLCRQ